MKGRFGQKADAPFAAAVGRVQLRGLDAINALAAGNVR